MTFDDLKSRFRDFLGGDVLQFLARGASAVLIIQIVSFALRYGVHVGLARWLGVDAYGVYVFALSMAIILGIVAKLGLPMAVLRFIPEYLEGEQWGKVRGLVQRTWGLTIASGCLLAGLGTGVLYGLGQWGYVGDVQSLMVGIWLVPLLAVMALQMQMIRGMERMTLAYAPSYLGRHGLVLLFVGAVYYGTGGVTSIQALLLTEGAILLVVIVQAILGWQRIPTRVRASTPAYETRHWLRVAGPLLLVASFNVVLNEADLFLLGVLRTSSDVGTYNAALKSSTVVSFLLTGINAIAAPRIARLYKKGSKEDLQHLVSLVAHLSFWPSLLGSIVLMMISGPFLRIFGPSFDVAQAALIILIVGQLANAAAGSVGYLMNLTGHQDECSRVFAWSALINVILNLILIPRFGIEGAAIATMTTTMLWNVWLNRLTIRYLGVSAWIFRLPTLRAPGS